MGTRDANRPEAAERDSHPSLASARVAPAVTAVSSPAPDGEGFVLLSSLVSSTIREGSSTSGGCCCCCATTADAVSSPIASELLPVAALVSIPSEAVYRAAIAGSVAGVQGWASAVGGVGG